MNGSARRRPGGIDDGVAGRPQRGQIRDVENEEGQLHHVAEAGSGLCQAAAQVLEHLPGLRGGIPGPDQLAALVLRNLTADHDQPALAGDHLTVAAPGGHPVRSYDMLQHDHQRPFSTAHSGAARRHSLNGHQPTRQRTRASSEF